MHAAVPTDDGTRYEMSHDMQHMNGFADAARLIGEHMSPRAQKMLNLERYVEGTQYVGRPNFFDRGVPLWHRAPCVVYPLAANVIQSNTDLVLGDSRWPRVTCRPGEDDRDFDESGLGLEESAHLDKLILEAQRVSRFRPAMREAFSAAQGCGSAVLMFGVRAGSLFIDSTKARWCEPEFHEDGCVKRLVIEYPYFATERVNGSWRVVAKLYRREIDETKDVTFKSETMIQGRYASPDWQVETRVNHGFDFCPVVWYPFMQGCSVVGNYDGHAIHETHLDEITALDFALSMKHRAALYSGDPQWTEIGVEPGYVPTGPGEIVTVPATSKGGPITSDNRPVGEYRIPQPKQGRRKGPGEVWQYESPDVKVQLHTLPGDALKALENHCMDLRTKLAESMSAVFLDPESVRFASALSGKALEVIRQRQLDRCEQYRDDVTARLLLPSINMLLRVAYVARQRGNVNLPGIVNAMSILAKSDHVESA